MIHCLYILWPHDLVEGNRVEIEETKGSSSSMINGQQEDLIPVDTHGHPHHTVQVEVSELKRGILITGREK